MLKKTVNYVDFNDNATSENLYFNLTQTEAVEFAMDLPDAVTKTVGDGATVDVNAASIELVKQLGNKGVFQFVKDLVLKSYGVPSADGKKFVKSAQLREEFEQSLAFDTLFMELMSDDNAAAQFVNGVLPAKLAERIPEVTGNN